jgi:hypothetical protein
MYSGGGSTPVPDPTVLTNQAVAQAMDTLRRELNSAVAVVDARLKGQHDVIETRLSGMDEAVRLIASWRERLPAEVKDAVSQLEAVGLERFRTIDQRFKTMDERFSGLEAALVALKEGNTLQFKERDTRSERESRDNKVAVDAAFAAQKEAASEQNKSNTLAIDKSEKATAETLNKQADLFKSTTDALGGRIEDTKQAVSKIDSRLTAIESRGVQVRETQGQSNWAIGASISVFALLISLAGLIVVLVKLG